MLVEVCVQNAEDALRAEGAGADRIELCAALETGGITPSAGLVQNALDRLNIPVHVLVRPRNGNFVYSGEEFALILREIGLMKEWGAGGIVTGIMDADGGIDMAKMAQIREATGNMHLTFHRAFDLLAEPLRSLDQLETLGVDTVLTSGQRKRAVDAIPLLLDLKDRSKRINIMPGAGIRPENILKFKDAGFKAIHFSGAKPVGRPDAEPKNNGFTVDDLCGAPRLKMDAEAVRLMIRSVK